MLLFVGNKKKNFGEIVLSEKLIRFTAKNMIKN